MRGWTPRVPRGKPPKPYRYDEDLTLKVAKLPCSAGPREEGSAQVLKATSDEAETQARHSIVQGELHFGRRDLGRTCLAAGACSTTTGGETAALLPLMAMCRTPRALTSTHRRGVVRSRNQRGVARTGQEGALGRERGAKSHTQHETPGTHTTEENDEDNRPQEWRRATTNPGSASGGGGAPRTQFLSEISRSDFNTEVLYL